MLDALRANKRGIVSWIIIGGISVIFVVSFGPGSLSRRVRGRISGSTSEPYAARVNGEVVGATEFERSLNRLFELYRAQSGGALTRELAVQLGLPSQALDLLVERTLVVQEAKRRGLNVTDEEVAEAVSKDPTFQVNGQFDRETYDDITRRNFGSPAHFEDKIREDLLYRHMLASVEETVKVSEQEAKQSWQLVNDRVALRYVVFPKGALEAAVKPTDAEVAAYAQKEAPKVKAFYDANQARFEQKRKVKARHILAKVAEGADDSAAKKKIEEAIARLKKGEDFATVAKGLSDDANTKDRGGDLGYIAEGLYDETFVKAALALEKGQLSGPVRTSAGWHVIRVDDVVPEKKVSLEQATNEIARELLVKEDAAKLGSEKAKALLLAAEKSPKALTDFKVKLGTRDVAAGDTGVFDASSEVVPKLGIVNDLKTDAFAAKADAVLSKVYETAAGPLIAMVTTRDRPDLSAWPKERDTAIEHKRREREGQVFQAWVKSLRDAANVEVNQAYLAEVAPGTRRGE